MTKRIAIVGLFVAAVAAVAVVVPRELRVLVAYRLFPDFPVFRDGQSFVLPGLDEAVSIGQYDDGRFRVTAANERDLYRTVGYLQARDRLFQMDLLRHIARGRLAELVGDVAFGLGTALDTDRFHRFIGLAEQAEQMQASLDAEQRSHLDAFADGVNAWIATGVPSFEHRLLAAEVEPWRSVDSLAIFRLLSFGLTHNYTREARRLLIACAIGLDAAQRVWPAEIEFGSVFLPPESIPKQEADLPPAIVPEMREGLAGLCPQDTSPEREPNPQGGEPLAVVDWLRAGMSTSNNWIVAASRTASGGALLANDPHLPHMNPPLAWGVHMVLPDREMVGFTLAGLPLVVFGHNFHVAVGATTNNVDLQDLYVERPVENGDSPAIAYEYDGKVLPFEIREETFRVRNAPDVVATVRYSLHGPLLNDLDPHLRGRIPLTALRSVDLAGAHDAKAVDRAGGARSADEMLDALSDFDSACQSWVFADTAGHIGFTSPCRVPVRRGWQGTFPVPGWTSKYEWGEWIDKARLPAARDPERGWMATANNRALPRNRYFTTYNNDPSPPDRYLRIAAELERDSPVTVETTAATQRDTRLSSWTELRDVVFAQLCEMHFAGQAATLQARLCDWDGDFASDSIGATVFVLLENAVLDATVAAHLPGGATGDVARYVLSVPHIETLIAWNWKRAADDPMWDDPRTPVREVREQLVRRAFVEAVAVGRERWGDDVRKWSWGAVRPFVLRHPMGRASALLGTLLDSPTLPGLGSSGTVFKNQFLRSDRREMHPGFGPVLRFVVDMHAPGSGRFALAGGQSGWPLAPHYGDLLQEWMANDMRPLSDPHRIVAVVRAFPD